MSFPTVEEVRQLERFDRLVVPDDWLDCNGHMNIRYYMAIHSEAGWHLMERFGYGRDAAVTRKRGVFDLSHHLNYLAEITGGDDVSVYCTVLARNDKRFHGMSFLVNETRGNLANTFEYVSAYVDLDTRRTASLDDDIAAAIDRIIEHQRSLAWAPPVCGAIAVDRREVSGASI